MSESAGKTALITGGASGIGRAAAEALLGQGASVMLVDRDTALLDPVVAELSAGGHRVSGFVADVRNLGELDAAVAATVERFGGLDILVAAAGIQRYGTVTETSEDLWAEVMDVNLTGAFLAAKAALPQLRERRGAIVLVSSVQAFVAQGGAAAYVTSKGAINAFARSLAIDEARFGVRANVVCPGSVDTPMLRTSARQSSDGTVAGEQARLAEWGKIHPLGRVARASEVGEVIAFLASERASFVTGASIPVDGGLTASVAVAVDR